MTVLQANGRFFKQSGDVGIRLLIIFEYIEQFFNSVQPHLVTVGYRLGAARHFD
jgi:hypothetical protein